MVVVLHRTIDKSGYSVARSCYLILQLFIFMLFCVYYEPKFNTFVRALSTKER